MLEMELTDLNSSVSESLSTSECPVHSVTCFMVCLLDHRTCSP